MASITNPVHSSIPTSRISSLYLSKNKVSTSCVEVNTRSLAPKATRLAFLPLPEKKESPTGVCFPSGPLKFSGWSQLIRRRTTVDFSVVSAAAADADGREIEISDGLDSLSSFCSFVILLFLLFGCGESEEKENGNSFSTWCSIIIFSFLLLDPDQFYIRAKITFFGFLSSLKFVLQACKAFEKLWREIPSTRHWLLFLYVVSY